MEWEKIKLGLIGAAGGAIALAIVGFNWGGWVTSSTAEVMAKEIAENAVAKRFTPACIARFNQDVKKEQKFKDFKAKDSGDGQKFVEEQGWAPLPGEERPDSKVAEGCAKQLMESSKAAPPA
jgi:hypothetical protein